MTAGPIARGQSSLIATIMQWYLHGEIAEQARFIRALRTGGVVKDGSPELQRQRRRLQALECRLAMWQR